MSDEIILGLLIGAVMGVWIYVIGTAIYLTATSNWFANTWFGKATNEAWKLIREAVQTILPPYKR